jgi:hypothetical protein
MSRSGDHLIWRLRHNETAKHLCGVAADEIERLRASQAELVDRLRHKPLDLVSVLAQEVRAQRELMAELYQVLGALNAPYSVLDRVLEASGGVLSSESLLPFDAPKLRARRGGAVNEAALECAKEVSAADEAYYRAGIGATLTSLEEAWKKYSEVAAANGAIIANELLRLSRDDDTE